MGKISGRGGAFMSAYDIVPATSDNSGHTAPLRSAQIGSLPSPTSYVRKTLYAIAKRRSKK
jgi:hypothetical protein